MIIKNVKAIIWDLDGTLLDSFEIFGEILAEIVAEEDYEMPSYAERVQHYHGTLDETLKNIFGIQSQTELTAIVDSFLLKQLRFYEGDMNNHLFDDAKKLAEKAKAKGVKQLIVTNREHEGRGSASPKAIVAASVLGKYIDGVHSGDESEYRKPDKRAAAEWLNDQGISPSQLLVIGDQHVDAQLAVNLNARTILVARNGPIPHLDSVKYNQDKLITVDSLYGVILTI